MKKVATLILNRNLPNVADQLYESIYRHNGDITDIFVIESGSDKDKLSKHCTWWANWEEALETGLRYPRGFNYGLLQLWREEKFKNYDFFFLLPNDVEFQNKPVIEPLLEELRIHQRVGIISPCSNWWGEKQFLGDHDTKYYWYLNMLAWMVRRECMEDIITLQNPDIMNFLFDGNNFRGLEADIEIVVKGYANDWATAITSKVRVEENESHLKTKADLIKTDTYSENLKLAVSEGRQWLRQKYGFNSRWNMQFYAKHVYDIFFKHYPEYLAYKI